MYMYKQKVVLVVNDGGECILAVVRVGQKNWPPRFRWILVKTLKLRNFRSNRNF